MGLIVCFFSFHGPSRFIRSLLSCCGDWERNFLSPSSQVGRDLVSLVGPGGKFSDALFLMGDFRPPMPG